MNKYHKYRLLLIGLVVVSLAAIGFVRAAYQPLNFRGIQAIQITPGTSLYSLTRNLNEHHLQIPDWMFLLIARLTAFQGPILAGEYAVEDDFNAVQLLAVLRKGDTVQRTVTFLEGWAFDQWRSHLRKQKQIRPDSALLTDIEIMQRIRLDESLAGTNPEGWFFPDTYFYSAGDSDLDLLQRAHKAMLGQLEVAWLKRDQQETQLTRYESLILASMIEKETGRLTDRTKIAAVFLNRLKRGMRLQSDPTVIYGLGKEYDGNLVRADLLGDTAHNTYVHKGLPPTPISMPGQESINSVMHPARTDYLYFVARGDGSSEFSRTLQAHNRAVRLYQMGN